MRRLTLSVLMLLSATPAADAVPITGYARGRITSAYRDTGPDTSGPQPFTFAVGSTVAVSFTFDPDRAVAAGDGRYEIRATALAFATSDGLAAASPGSLTPGGDAITVRDAATDVAGFLLGSPSLSFLLVYSDPSGGAISSTALPTLADLARFPTVNINMDREVGRGADGFVAIGVPAADLDPSPVPEPSTLAMGLAGMTLIGIRRWRRVA